MSLKDCIAADIGRTFLNVVEFCDTLQLHIGNRSVVCRGSLQSNRVRNTSGNGGPLQENSWTLYLAYPVLVPGAGDTVDEIILSAGQHITIDGKSYTIVDVSNEMGLATVNLTTRAWR